MKADPKHVIDLTDSNFEHDESNWTIEDYKRGLKAVHNFTPKAIRDIDIICKERINEFPYTNYRVFFKELSDKETKTLPFRVNGKILSTEKQEFYALRDIMMQSFTVYNKHSYMTIFIYNMLDERVQKESFLQVSLERFYSRKKGYGSKLLSHIIKIADKHNITLTVWCENEKLSNYYIEHGFTKQYRSITTAHYFLTYNL